MMRTLLVVLLMIIATTASAQSEVRLRVGMTLKEIRDEVPEAIERDKGHGNHLVQESDNEIVVYFFDDDGVCNVQVYVYSIEGVPEVVETLKSTKNMVMISDREFMY